MRLPYKKWIARARDLWRRARQEHSSPREVGWSVALGVFIGCTPFIGLHMWLALGLATLLELNRLWAFLGSRISSSVLFAWLGFSEIELAHRARTGAWLKLAPAEVMTAGWKLLGDWLLGALVVGSVLAAFFGLLAWSAARRWQRTRQAETPPDAAPVSPRTPDEPRPPSSGSPPSAPPAPPQ